jgi:hypothetical protein
MRVRQLILILILAGAFGVLVPFYKGIGFLDRRLIIAYGCLAAVIAGPTAADAFSTEGTERAGSALAKMVRIWLISWGLGVCVLALALATVNLTNRHSTLLLPRVSFLVAVECLSITTAAALTALGAVLSRKFSGAMATAVFRTMFLVVIVVLFLADRFLTISLTTTEVTRNLYIVSGIFGAAALVLTARYPET